MQRHFKIELEYFKQSKTLYLHIFRVDPCTLNDYPGYVFYIHFIGSNPSPLIGAVQVLKMIFERIYVQPKDEESNHQNDDQNDDPSPLNMEQVQDPQIELPNIIFVMPID